MTDDKRVRIDSELKENVLEPMHSKFNISMLAAAKLCASWAMQNELPPLPPEKGITITGDVFVGEPIYKLVAHVYETNEPRRVAHELMNAGINDLRERYLETDSLIELFGLAESPNQQENE